jgi:hypothetical protein
VYRSGNLGACVVLELYTGRTLMCIPHTLDLMEVLFWDAAIPVLSSGCNLHNNK